LPVGIVTTVSNNYKLSYIHTRYLRISEPYHRRNDRQVNELVSPFVRSTTIHLDFESLRYSTTKLLAWTGVHYPVDEVKELWFTAVTWGSLIGWATTRDTTCYARNQELDHQDVGGDEKCFAEITPN